MVCNRCKKQFEEFEHIIYVQLFEVYIDNLEKEHNHFLDFHAVNEDKAKVLFCINCWNEIKNLNGVPGMFKGKVRDILKDWGLNELFN